MDKKFDGTIADIGEVIGGATPSKKMPGYFTNRGIGWITPRDLSNTSDKFIDHGAVDITQTGYDSCSVRMLPAGSVLFSSRAPIGYVAIAAGDLTTNQGFKSVVPLEGIGSAFVYCFLKRNSSRIADAGSGTTFPEVSGKSMKSIPLTLPDMELCAEFTEWSKPLLEQQRSLESETRSLKRLRDALLPKLMSGEIDVSKVEVPTQPNSHFIQSTYLLMADTGFGKHNSNVDGGQMPRGIIYVMTTVVPGLVKIGKSGTGNFEQRMYQLERNGYFNVTGLRRLFAIEVEDYDEKELMLDEIFSRSRVPNSELFALDPELAVQLLSSFEGRQVYPELESKEQSFDQATRERRANPSGGPIPDGTYSMSRRLKREGSTVSAAMTVAGGRFVVPRGTRVARVDGAGLSSGVAQLRRAFVGPDGVTTDDVEFSSPSSAGSFVIGASCDGWVSWRDADGRTIDHFRGTED